MALRPEGIRVSEAIKLGLVKDTLAAMHMMARAEYLCGYDIRRAGRRKTTNTNAVTYYLVGRHRWTGGYRSFRVVDESLPSVRNDKSKLEPA